VNSRAWLRRFDDATGVTKTDIFCVEQLELNRSKNNFIAKGDNTLG